MTARKERWIRVCFLVVSFALLTAGSIAVLDRKEAYFTDEYSSYGCANGAFGKNIQFKNGVAYAREEIRQKVLETFGVPESRRFHFGTVWKNLGRNVHPPAFYAALHLVCSLTPGVFSKWQAGAVNIVFGLVSLVFFWKFAQAFTKSKWLSGGVCIAWTCTLGLFGNIVFLRDYAAAMCGSLMVTWEGFRFLRGNRGIQDRIKLAAASAFSVLCHYYCLIHLFFLCATLCVVLMLRKDWKSVLGVVAAEAAAGVAAVAIFPAMVTQIMKSKRGVEAAENFIGADGSAFVERLGLFARDVNNSFFGGLLPCVLILALALAVATLLMMPKGRGAPKTTEITLTAGEIVLLFVPPVLYGLVISKIAPYIQLRYMYPVTTILYLSVFATLAYSGRNLLKPPVLVAGLSVVLAAMSGLSWKTGSFKFLYEGKEKTMTECLAPYEGIDAVLIWTGFKSRLNPTLPETRFYGTTAFYYKSKKKDLRKISAFEKGKDVMVLTEKGTEGSELALLEMYPGYTMEPVRNGKANYDNRHFYFHRGE